MRVGASFCPTGPTPGEDWGRGFLPGTERAAPRRPGGHSGPVPQFPHLCLRRIEQLAQQATGTRPHCRGRRWHTGHSCPGQIKEQRQELGQTWACCLPVGLGTPRQASSEEGGREKGPGASQSRGLQRPGPELSSAKARHREGPRETPGRAGCSQSSQCLPGAGELGPQPLLTRPGSLHPGATNGVWENSPSRTSGHYLGHAGRCQPAARAFVPLRECSLRARRPPTGRRCRPGWTWLGLRAQKCSVGERGCVIT